MKLRLLISRLSISLLALAAQKVCAQSAEEFFHGGAQSYLSNNVEGARQEVDKGLKLYPDDLKLKKLDELLKQQQQQQQQNQQQQQQQKDQQQKQDQQNQSKQDQQQQKQKQDEEKQKQQDQQQQQKPKEQQKGEQQKQDEDQKPKEQQGKPGEMSPDEAKKLLDSQKGDEALLPANHNDKPREHPLKDW